jgi:hypothetical protein
VNEEVTPSTRLRVFAARRLPVKHDGEIEDYNLNATMSSLVCMCAENEEPENIDILELISAVGARSVLGG